MLNLVIRTLILYGTVILSLRVMGKRQLGELQPSELVVAIMISDLASVPMQTIDMPIISGILPVLTLIVAEVILSYISLKSKKARSFFTGKPNIVIYDGKIMEKELERLRFNVNDLISELRLNGCFDISEVAVAVVETSGKISVIEKQGAQNVTLDDLDKKPAKRDTLPCMLISDGSINREELRRSGHSLAWLKEELEKRQINGIKDVFVASLNGSGELFIQRKEGRR
ncbi:MAG: DUF421 domain-containing protein [Clostridiales bacterium]|nr:DUF421 domain-containing protein [Clostridiales bacterium]